MFGYRGWRKQWGQNRRCGGALVWQLNDCWPVTSWSIVDYYQRKKPAYYTIRRVLAPIAIAIRREHWDWSVAHARSPTSLQWECWIASKEDIQVEGVVEIRFVSIATGKDVKKSIKTAILIVPNGTTTVTTEILDVASEDPHVLAARLWVNDVLISRDCDWPQPFKYLNFKDRGVNVEWSGGDFMRISAKKPTKGVVFEERDNVLLEDNALEIVPGDEQTLRVQGLTPEATPLQFRFLGME
jgi:beta-mannosidase